MWHSEQPLSLVGSFTCQEEVAPATSHQQRAANGEWQVTAAGHGMGSSMEQRSSRSSRGAHHVNIQVPLVEASDDEDDASASIPRRITRSTSVNDTSRTSLADKHIYYRPNGVRHVRSQSVPSFLHKTKCMPQTARRISMRLLRTHLLPKANGLSQFDRRQKLVFLSLALVDFISFCSMSIMAPFFPREAHAKGVNTTTSGLIFSFYAFVMFVSSPIFGKILPLVGAKFMFMSGMFVAGGCSVIFGLIDRILDTATFIAYSFLLRGTEALGAAAYSTASYTFVVQVFPDHIGPVMGVLETFVGLGMSVGPVIGGVLYSIGGFGLPFYTLGVLMIIFVPVNIFLLPAADAVRPKSGSILEVLQVPSVIVIGLVVIVSAANWGFLDPTLEPHLRQFNLSPQQVALTFLLTSGLYAIASPLWGLLATRIGSHWLMMCFGLLLCTFGLLTLGPSPLMPFLPNSLWVTLVSLAILGVAAALTLLPTYQAVLDAAVAGGCSDDLPTYSIVAGVWSGMYSLGEVLGPTMGGIGLEWFGFPMCATLMAAVTFGLALVVLIFFSIHGQPVKPEKIGGDDDDEDDEEDDTYDAGDGQSRTSEDSPLMTERQGVPHNSSYGSLQGAVVVTEPPATLRPKPLRTVVASSAAGAIEV